MIEVKAQPNLYVEQLYTGCLAEAAYYIESNGEAVIIDPLRETEPYMELAAERGAKIKYVMETHFHADFVSGHLDLSKKTDAKIVFGPLATPNYEAIVAKDGQEFSVGNVKIKVLHTPGHTMESSTFLLIDEKGKNRAIFTGDTLFIGDVGRPDLAVKTDLTREDLAGHLYDSLRNKIIVLEDEVVVYPGHGAGSACGKMMSKETTDTLGHQKEVNYALRADMSKEEFVEAVTEGLVAPPQYFPKNAVMNKMGYESIDHILEQGLVGLSVDEFEKYAKEQDVLVIDTRHPDVVPRGFVPGSVFVGIDDNFAPWIGALIEDLQTPIIFVADEGREEEVVTRLARVGYDNPQGYLSGGFEAWKAAGKQVDTLDEVKAEEFARRYDKGYAKEVTLLDVRKESEYNSEHVEGAVNFPLDFINQQLDELDPKGSYFIHCQGGYRSLIAATMLRKAGFYKLVNIKGGYKALKETNLAKTQYVEPTTML